MARFIGTTSGRAASEASRLGNPSTGIRAAVNGWNAGLKVDGQAVEGDDIFAAHLTGGSNDSDRDRLVLTFRAFEPGGDKAGRRELTLYDPDSGYVIARFVRERRGANWLREES